MVRLAQDEGREGGRGHLAASLNLTLTLTLALTLSLQGLSPRPSPQASAGGEGVFLAGLTRFALAFTLLLSALPARAVEVVRIAVVVGAPRVDLRAAGLTFQGLAEDAQEHEATAGRAVVTMAGGRLAVDGEAVDAPALLFKASDPIRVAGLSLAGDVEVRRAAAGLDVIHALPMEDYVAAVTGSEMPASFPPAALQAQAVAARTFALFKKLESVAQGRPWHLGATVLHQVYRGSSVPGPARAAADATAGLVLTWDHAPIEAYFHAACGGKTESGAAALGRDLPYLQPVECGRCRGAPRFSWTVRVPVQEMGRLAGLGGAVTRARVASRTASGRAERVELEAGARRVALGAVDLRQRLGFSRLPSLAFEVRREGAVVRFDGRGAGHGAGLCQWGAAGFAREGEGFREILARYYPGTEIIRMY